MKVYVSTKFERTQDVHDLFKKLIEAGHNISYDWTTHKPIKPYKDNPEMSAHYAQNEINGIRNADVFLVLSDEGGTAMHIEFGIALMLNILHNKPKIFVVGPHNARSTYYFLPQVNRRETVQEVIEEIS